MQKPKVMLLGKLPPPVMGPALATQIILESRLDQEFDIRHFDTRLNKTLNSMGRVGLGKLMKTQQQFTRFKKELAHFNPDIVHIPIGQTTIGFWKDARYIHHAAKSGARVVLHLRGSAFRDWYESNTPWRKKAIRNILRKADGMIVLSKSLRYLFQSLIRPEKIFVVPNGADFELPKEVDRHSKCTEILYLSNFLPGKGFDTLIKACSILQDKRVADWRLQAHGSWDSEEFRRHCESLIARYELNDRVKIGEPVSGTEKWNALARADIFAFTPRNPEGLPWSMVEACAAGLPVVCTRQGAIPDTLINGETGFLHKSEAVEEIAESLQSLIENDEMRALFSRNARKHYETNFTAEHMVSALEGVYRQILEPECAE